jgi:hypothetical protein
MKTTITRSISTMLALGLLALNLTSLDSNAGERQRSGSFQNSRGRNGTFDQNIERQRGQRQPDTTLESDRVTTTRNTNANWNREEGTANRSTVTTGPNGKSATVEKNATRDGNAVIVDGSRTGFNGQTSTWDKSVTKNGDGTATVNTDYTRQDGTTVNASSTITKTDSGQTKTGSYTTSTGQSGTFAKEIVNADATRTKTQTVTGANGQSADRVVETTKDDNTLNRTATTTGPSGEVHTHSASATVNP